MASPILSPLSPATAALKGNGLSPGVIALGAAAALLPPATIAVFSALYGIAAHRFTRDPISVAHLHPLTGVLSNLGCLVWGASAAIWLFCATLHRKRKATQRFRFALSSGILSAYLTFDDLFLFHDEIAPHFLRIPENAVYAGLVVAVAIYLFLFRRMLLQRDGLLLFLSFAFLGCSLMVDAVFESWLLRLGHWLVFLEDALKWLGIFTWCAFCVARCRADLLKEFAPLDKLAAHGEVGVDPST